MYIRKEFTSWNLKYFFYEFKKTYNLGKLYLLPKLHKRQSDVPGRSVISNCDTPTEKVSEFLDFHLKPIMRIGNSCMRDSSHFLEKIKNIRSVPDNALLVTSDVVGLYPSIPTSDLVEIGKFVLSNNYFEFSEKVFNKYQEQLQVQSFPLHMHVSIWMK